MEPHLISLPKRSGDDRPPSALGYSEAGFTRHGSPHRILAGAVHYFRVHPAQWQDRLRRLKAMGANTLDTYVAWNFHQRSRDAVPDFSDWKDVGRFIDLAGEEGLDVVVRPGPYICAEWDNGGLPAWVTALPGIRLRSSDPAYQAACEEWLDTILPVIVPRQACFGGPVVAVQVENEYGSYGDDREHVQWLHNAIACRGITELLFTADGGEDHYLDGGALPGVLAAATFGSRAAEAAATWRRRRPREPFFAAEFWCGWFDHWGNEYHGHRDPEEAARELRTILDSGGSASVYMAHGGTNFGVRSGANIDTSGIYRPTVTSYDYDAPIAENGVLTPKFHAFRREFFRARGHRDVPDVPTELLAPPATLPSRAIPVTPARGLLDIVRKLGARTDDGVLNREPLTFEALGLDAGFVLYTARPIVSGHPDGTGRATVAIRGLADRAHVWADGIFQGILERATPTAELEIEGSGREVLLEILVENTGRPNYGPALGEPKGILDGVLVNQRRTFGWTHTLLRPEDWGDGELDQLSSAAFNVQNPADTFLALPGFTKGLVWINGFLLGRYWCIGPQQTLYIPAPLVAPGVNRLHIFELEQSGEHVELRTAPELGRRDVLEEKA